MNYLLDTNVVSEIRKPQADENVRAWFASTRADELYLSVLTVGEIRRGIERLQRRDAAQASIHTGTRLLDPFNLARSGP